MGRERITWDENNAGIQELFLSLLSVPDPPANVQPPLIYGTRNIYLRWDEPNLVPAFSTLRGDPANLQYVVRVNGTYNITIDANEVNLTAADQLQPETTHSIEVGLSIASLGYPDPSINCKRVWVIGWGGSVPCAWNAGALPIGLIITFQRVLIEKVVFESRFKSCLERYCASECQPFL